MEERNLPPEASHDPAEAPSRERMKAMLDASWDILSLLDEDGRILYNSPAAHRLHGFSAEEMAGRPTFEFYHPEDVSDVGEALRRCLASPGRPVWVQYRFARKDGSWMWMEAVALNRLEDPSIRAIVVNSRDISERVSRRDELERLTRLYATLSLLGQSLVKSRTRLGLLQDTCAIAAEHGGYGLAWVGWLEPKDPVVAPVALAGRALGYLGQIQVRADDHPFAQGPMGRAIREGRVYVCQEIATDPLMEPWRTEALAHGLRSMVAIPIRFEDACAGALGVYAERAWIFGNREVALLEEVSKLISFGLEHLANEERSRQLEAELQQAQKLENLGSLAGGVAHDINNVLGAILGLASANLELHPEGTPAHQAFGTIAKAASRGGEMVRSLLSFSRQKTTETRLLHLNPLVQEAVRLLERTTLARLQMVLELAEDLRPIQGDPSALSHAIMNLCVNAVDAMPDGGVLSLGTRNLSHGGVELRIQDTGSGMTQEVLERALDPFFTTKEQGKGTGLGLSIVYSTVKAHGGRLEIQSEPGLGTSVCLTFPEAPAGAELQPPEPAGETLEERRPLRVLLVDDDDLVCEAVQASLTMLGHQATVAHRGEVAIHLLESGLELDAIILDMNMPGLGGAKTLPRLRALNPDVPVLLATGRVDQAALDLAEAHAHVTLLPKPFSAQELGDHLRAGRR